MNLVRSVAIENYKSIQKLSFELGRVNVLIGANGSGKSNALEAIALASADSRGKTDNEYLAPRGIRVTEPRFMRSAFPGAATPPFISVEVTRQSGEHVTIFDPERRPAQVEFETVAEVKKWVEAAQAETTGPEHDALKILANDPAKIRALLERFRAEPQPPDFIIYAPENSALRVFQSDGQVLPLGSRGDGLFAHLKRLSSGEHAATVAAIADQLALLDWFERLEVPKDLAPGERSILIRDRYLAEGALFDQRSANEGFLFLLFYFTLLLSPETPAFFAIDNVETSLNPKLCTRVVEQIVRLARERDKQVILSTHSPAVLDGLDLADDEQRLFVTERRRDGDTRIRRVEAPKTTDGTAPMKLSEAFVGGYLGGLPKNF